jgi:hypothetical protein
VPARSDVWLSANPPSYYEEQMEVRLADEKGLAERDPDEEPDWSVSGLTALAFAAEFLALCSHEPSAAAFGLIAWLLRLCIEFRHSSR